MPSRRTFLGLAGGAAGLAPGSAFAQGAAGQPQGDSESALPDRGAPTGRTGAATRGAQGAAGNLTLNLVAPLRGVGLSSANQPELYYVLSGGITHPVRLTISIHGQARPLADFQLPPAARSGLGVARLRDNGIRLPQRVLCTWSVTMALNPRSPSQDMVGSALVEYRPDDPAAAMAARESLPGRIAALARAGYWYDAVTAAVQGSSADQGAALAALFKQEDLPSLGPALADPSR